jgi:hypothetical protein
VRRYGGAWPPSGSWPAISYEESRPTFDTLHAHTQVLGKLAATLAPPEPQLQHAALRLTARGWETALLAAPDGYGALVVVLDLHTHQAVVECDDGRRRAVSLVPNRPVGEVTREVLGAVREIAGPVEIDPTPQEVEWSVPLDEDAEHATYDERQVAAYFAAATRAALVLAAFRAPYARPAPGDFGEARLSPAAARWDAELGLYVLDWDDVRAVADPHSLALEFAHSAFQHACLVCDWDENLAASAEGTPPPVS